MSEYKPKKTNHDSSHELGWLPLEFEAFEPDANPNYSFKPASRPKSKDDWPIIVPKKAPPIGDLPSLIEKVVKATWKFAEPSKGAQRGDTIIGTRGGAVPTSTLTETYHSQVRPVKQVLTTGTPNPAAIAADWKVFDQIKRTNSVSFRGDTRSPLQVLAKAGGFSPPDSRQDRYYLENNIYEAFADYLSRRAGRKPSKPEFLAAVDGAAPSPEAKKLLVDYMMWRKITEREAVHLGRMVENECLKGYISTSKAIDSSMMFGSKYHKAEGWLYLVIVHGGFVVPWGAKNQWGLEEAEIAQWGPIPAERIVGFRHLDNYSIDGPVYIRRSFRKNEPEAFKYNV
jgi:hypothetical protein